MPNVDPIPGAETCYEGMDGYALVDKARYEAMEAENSRLRSALRDIAYLHEFAVEPLPERVRQIVTEALREGDRT